MALEAEAEVFSVALSPDCRTVAAACGGFVAIWRSERHITGWTTDSPPEQHERLFEGDRYVYAVRFSPDRGGQYLASADQGGLGSARGG